MPGRSLLLEDFADIAAVIVFNRNDDGRVDVVPIEIEDAAPLGRRTLALGLRAMADHFEAQAEAAGD